MKELRPSRIQNFRGLLQAFKEIKMEEDESFDEFYTKLKNIVELDGCHLKGKFGEHILSATAKDGNENIFPVALGIVEQENKDSWVWFLQTFADDIGRPDELNLVFISDRQNVIQFICFLRLLFVFNHYISAF